MQKKFIVELQTGVPSEYFIVNFGWARYYCDHDGLIELMANSFDGHHPAYMDEWEIKSFDKDTLTLSRIDTAKIAHIVHDATKIYLKKIVDGEIHVID